jgi:hypothetical protein
MGSTATAGRAYRWPAVRIVRTSFALAGLLLGALCAVEGCGQTVITGEDYAPQYDYSEFYAAADNKPFTVFLWGNPFPELSDAETRQRLLPVLQANRPQARLTFTYDAQPERPRPFYRVVLVFDPAPDLTAASVCADRVRRRPVPQRPFDLFAVYCRNNAPLSQASSTTAATGPEDQRVADLFRQLFAVLFAQRYPDRDHSPFRIIRM